MKRFSIIIVLSLLMSLLLTGCGEVPSPPPVTTPEKPGMKIARRVCL